MTPVRLEPAATRCGVKHSTNEPLRSQQARCVCVIYDDERQKQCPFKMSKCFLELKFAVSVDGVDSLDRGLVHKITIGLDKQS